MLLLKEYLTERLPVSGGYTPPNIGPAGVSIWGNRGEGSRQQGALGRSQHIQLILPKLANNHVYPPGPELSEVAPYSIRGKACQGFCLLYELLFFARTR